MLRITVFIIFLSCALAGTGVLPIVDDTDYPEEEPTKIEFISNAASIVDIGIEVYNGVPQHPEMTKIDPTIFDEGWPSIPLLALNAASMLADLLGFNEFPTRKNVVNKSKTGAKKKSGDHPVYNTIFEMVNKHSKPKY